MGEVEHACILTEPAGASALAGPEFALAEGPVSPEEETVVHATAPKNPQYQRPKKTSPTLRAVLSEVGRALKG